MSKVERAVKTYWEISKAFHRRPGALPISTSMAMNMVNTTIDSVGPHRRVVHHLGTLQENIIIGRKGVA